MRIVKYAFATILMILGLVIVSEKYQLYLSSFQSFYSISFSCNSRDDYSKMMEEIQPETQGIDIDLFYAITEYNGDYDSKVSIYCSDRTKQRLIKEYWYSPGTTKSLFFGQTQIEYRDYHELTYDEFAGNFCAGYVFGDFEQLVMYKRQLIDAYGGAYPKAEGVNERRESKVLVSVVWGVIFVIMLGCTYFTRLAGQKEYFVRASVGDTLLKNAITLAITDIFVYAGIFLGGIVLFRLFLGRIICFSIIIVSFICFLLINSFIVLRLPFTRFRYAVSNVTVSEELVGVSYLFQSVILVFLLLCVSSSVVSFVEYNNVKNQEWFYQNYEGYKYIHFSGSSITYCKEKEAEFYSDYFEPLDISSCFVFGKSEDYEVVVLNYNMKWYLDVLFAGEQLTEVDKVTCFCPESTSIEEIEQLIFPLQTTIYGADENDSVRFVSYSDRISVINQESGDYRERINPIIMYSPYHTFDEAYNSRDIHSLRLSRYFVRYDDEILQNFAKTNQLDFFTKDVYGDYCHYKTTLRRLFVTSIAFSIALFVLGCIMSVALVRAEFESRRIEIAILKTMGMSNWYRYKKVYLITAVSGVVSCFAAVAVSMETGYGNPLAVLLLGMAVLGADFLFLWRLSIRNESFEVTKTLKNG